MAGRRPGRAPLLPPHVVGEVPPRKRPTAAPGEAGGRHRSRTCLCEKTDRTRPHLKESSAPTGARCEEWYAHQTFADRMSDHTARLPLLVPTEGRLARGTVPCDTLQPGEICTRAGTVLRDRMERTSGCVRQRGSARWRSPKNASNRCKPHRRPPVRSGRRAHR